MPLFPNPISKHSQTFIFLYPAYVACIIYQTLVFVNFVLTQNTMTNVQDFLIEFRNKI